MEAISLNKVDENTQNSLDNLLSADSILKTATTPIIIRKKEDYSAIWMNAYAIELYEGANAPKIDPVVVGDAGEYVLKHADRFFKVRINSLKGASELRELIGSDVLIFETYHDITAKNEERQEEKSRAIQLGYVLPELDIEIIGRSEKIRKTFEKARLFAESNHPVLLFGQTGTGKDLLARAIHKLSRRKGEYVVINCSHLRGESLVSELFGHLKGSYTGAYRDKKGLFEIADNGTLFLDEIADMDIEVQTKILRAIEYRKFRRLGGMHEITSDVRIVAATNKDLKDNVKEVKFREDLYYRLGFPIYVPSLSERTEDIPLLISHFIYKLNEGRRVKKMFSQEAIDALIKYKWPGNIRELIKVIEIAFILSGENPVIPKESLPSEIYETRARDLGLLTLKEQQTAYVRKVLVICENNKSRAAKILGISRATIIRYLQK